MLVITGSNQKSTLTVGMRGEELNRTRHTAAAKRRCRDDFAMALAPYGIDRRDVPSAFVPLVNVEVQDGRMEILPSTSGIGEFNALRAEMDLLIAVSKGPQEGDPCNAGNATAIRVAVYGSDSELCRSEN